MFTPTTPLMQKPDHFLFKQIDWKQLAATYVAIIDPMDPDSIMYLSKKEYERTCIVAMSNDFPVVVLAKGADAIKRLASEESEQS